MIDFIFLLFILAVFIAVVLGLEGGYIWWNTWRSPEAKRLERRLRSISAGGHGQDQQTLLKRRVLSKSAGVERLLLRVPRVHQLDRVIIQSGLNISVSDLLGLTVLLAAIGLLAPLYLQRGVFFALALMVMLGALPTLYLLHAKAQRLIVIDNQLPDAIDLMGRALRAGHAFPTSLSMVGDEMPDPIGGEFRTLFDEINYGVSLQNALLNLLARVPSTDLRYFVVAVLIQRETGGNLAELLDNISMIVRSRIKLMGQVRTLSAEGRLSAWILALLPFVTGFAIHLTNPGFLRVLWTDPKGLQLVYGALMLMVFGIWWMTRIIKIRV